VPSDPPHIPPSVGAPRTSPRTRPRTGATPGARSGRRDRQASRAVLLTDARLSPETSSCLPGGEPTLPPGRPNRIIKNVVRGDVSRVMIRAGVTASERGFFIIAVWGRSCSGGNLRTRPSRTSPPPSAWRRREPAMGEAGALPLLVKCRASRVLRLCARPNGGESHSHDEGQCHIASQMIMYDHPSRPLRRCRRRVLPRRAIPRATPERQATWRCRDDGERLCAPQSEASPRERRARRPRQRPDTAQGAYAWHVAPRAASTRVGFGAP
jgi:hypothetical protein